MVTATTTYLHHATGKEMVDILDECCRWVQAYAFTQAVSLNVTAANGTSVGQAISLDAAGT